MPLSRKFLILSIFVLLFTFKSNLVSGVSPATAILIELAEKHGAPFVTTALDRLYGAIFGSGRATRSTDVVLINKSCKTFELQTSNCKHGGFTTNLFPETQIPTKKSSVYGVESNGFAIGVECTTRYVSSDGTFFEVTSDNPFIGSNSLSHSHSQSLKLTSTKGQGDNNQVRWIIEDK